MSKTTKLVILAGSPRGGIKTWKSIYKNLIDENTDLAICTGDSLQNNFTLRRTFPIGGFLKNMKTGIIIILKTIMKKL